MVNEFMTIIKTNGSHNGGYLSFFESQKDIPFDLKRIYYIYDVPVNTKRGQHAHKKLNQILWCPYGEIEVILTNGKEQKTYWLNSPEKALIVLAGYWHDMYWKKEGSVLCVAASEHYDELDYIRDYDEFLKYVGERYWDYENKL